MTSENGTTLPQDTAPAGSEGQELKGKGKAAAEEQQHADTAMDEDDDDDDEEEDEAEDDEVRAAYCPSPATRRDACLLWSIG